MLVHEFVYQMKVANVCSFNFKHSFIDLIYEINCILKVFLYRVLGNQNCIFDLFVIEKSCSKVSESLTPFLLSL